MIPGTAIISETVAKSVGEVSKEMFSFIEKLKISPEEKAEKRLELTNMFFEFEKAISEAANNDVANARDKDLKLQLAGKKDWVSISTAIVLHVSFIFCLMAVIFLEISQSNKEIFYMMLGSIISGEVTLISFNWGSSKGSKEKDITASELTDMNTQLTKDMMSNREVRRFNKLNKTD